MKIYTKHGDDGTTGLFGGGRVPKSSRRIEAYGTVDELNSMLGLVRTESPDLRTEAILDHLQHHLFVLGADLATPLTARNTEKIRRIGDHETAQLESWIDEIDARLPALTAFILPGGARCAALLHLARTICRRAERSTVQLAAEESIGPAPVIYLNRLSDLLFVLARFENVRSDIRETLWKG